MTRKMVRSGVIPIRNSQFARNNYVPFCSFLFLCGLSCQRRAEVRLAACGQLAWHSGAQPRFHKRSQEPGTEPGPWGTQLRGRSRSVLVWGIGMDRELSQLAALRQARSPCKCWSRVVLSTRRGLGKSALRRQPAACWSQSRCEYGTGWEEACVSQKHEMRFLSDFLFLRNGAGGVNRESDDCDDRHQHQTREILDHG